MMSLFNRREREATPDQLDQYRQWAHMSRDFGASLHERPTGADVVCHHDSWIGFDKLEELTLAPEYRPTFPGSEWQGEGYRQIMEAPLGRMGVPFLVDLGIDGYLIRADALKVYEMARCCRGDVLELGTHRGLSTSLIARALNDRGEGKLETVDIDARANAIARENVGGVPGSDRVNFTVKDATKRMDELTREGRQFGFIFVDHWHGYDATHEAAERVPALLTPGGFVLFHDFLDRGNADPKHAHGVFQAVIDVYAKDIRMAFLGNYGCCGLFRRGS
jgi:SAM-dependent methyltransferase